MFDSGSQRTYISQRVADKLNLVPSDTQDMVIKTFGNLSNKSVKANEYRFCLKGFNGSNFYLKGYGVPVICAPISGQKIAIVKEHFPFLKSLEFSIVKCGD